MCLHLLLFVHNLIKWALLVCKPSLTRKFPTHCIHMYRTIIYYCRGHWRSLTDLKCLLIYPFPSLMITRVSITITISVNIVSVHSLAIVWSHSSTVKLILPWRLKWGLLGWLSCVDNTISRLYTRLIVVCWQHYFPSLNVYPDCPLLAVSDSEYFSQL